jgi:hypothetical protein
MGCEVTVVYVDVVRSHSISVRDLVLLERAMVCVVLRMVVTQPLRNMCCDRARSWAVARRNGKRCKHSQLVIHLILSQA